MRLLLSDQEQNPNGRVRDDRQEKAAQDICLEKHGVRFGREKFGGDLDAQESRQSGHQG